MTTKATSAARHIPTGFALPTILIASVVMLMVLLAAVQSVVASRTALNSQYYRTLAREAAESGIVKAQACIVDNDLTLPWSGTVLSTTTDCYGDADPTASQYVLEEGNIRTYFSIDHVETAGAYYDIRASGTTELTRTSTGEVWQSYNESVNMKFNFTSTYATDVASGTGFTCGIISAETWCWGAGGSGKLGIGSVEDSAVPVRVIRENGVLNGRADVNIAAGINAACIISSGRVYCWGQGSYGKLGNGDTQNMYVPVAVDTSTGMTSDMEQVAMGNNHACALTVAGDVWCWGRNHRAQLGVGETYTQSLTPVRVAGIGSHAGLPVSKIAISVYSDSSCAIVQTASGDRAYCWGYNDAGQLGDGTTTTRTVPVQAGQTGDMANRSVTAITIAGVNNTYGGHACAVADSRVYCWGYGTRGVLGNGSSADQYVPTAVSTSGVLADKDALDVTMGLTHACATARDGSGNIAVYCWGSHSHGQLGNGTPFSTGSSVPVAVYVEPGGLEGREITKLSGGGNRSCVIASNTTFCWGLNDLGQLGDGTLVNRQRPVRSSFLESIRPATVF